MFLFACRVRYRKEDGAYVLSLMYEKEPRHYKIEQHLNRLSIEGGQYFETLIEVSSYGFCQLTEMINDSYSNRILKYSTKHGELTEA